MNKTYIDDFLFLMTVIIPLKQKTNRSICVEVEKGKHLILFLSSFIKQIIVILETYSFIEMVEMPSNEVNSKGILCFPVTNLNTVKANQRDCLVQNYFYIVTMELFQQNI